MDGFGESPKKGGGGGGSSADRSKMIKGGLAIVLFIAVALVFAMNFGLIGGEKIEPPSEDKLKEVEQEIQRQIKEEEDLLIEQPELVKSGAG